MSSQQFAIFAILQYLHSMFNTTPHIGQVLDYYPSPSERLAAICIEVLPIGEEFGDRPKVNLFVLFPNGKIDNKLEVLPVSNSNVSSDGFSPDLEGKWGFAHEFAILQKDATDSPLGTNSNEHVGSISNTL